MTSDDLPTFGRPITAMRDRVLVLISVRRRVFANGVRDAVEQVARAEAVRGRDRLRLAEAEPWNSAASGESAPAVELVRHHDRGHPRAPHDVAQLGVARAQAGGRVDHQQRGRRILQRDPRLVLDLARQRLAIRQVHAPGVDQRERDAVPLGRAPPCGPG